MRKVAAFSLALLLLPLLLTSTVWAQPPAPVRVVSPQIAADRNVTFRIPAPNAAAVSLQSAGDMPQVPFGGGLPMTKNANGVWEVTVQLDPGAYRYNFSVDGVRVLDPNSPRVSESNDNAHSWLHVDGSAWMDANAVQHGAIAEVNYASSALNRTRRMHVYTPPGFKADTQYPVFYLLHGAIAGLSRGGAQTLDVAFSDLKTYGYIGVYSSGVFGIDQSNAWEQAHLAALDDAALKNGLELVWFSTGTDDFLIETTRKTVSMIESHGFDVDYTESSGGHTWINWREYLNTFAPQLFK